MLTATLVWLCVSAGEMSEHFNSCHALLQFHHLKAVANFSPSIMAIYDTYVIYNARMRNMQS